MTIKDSCCRCWICDCDCCEVECNVCTDHLSRRHVNCIIALIAGFIFSSGWWIMIDATFVFAKEVQKHKVYWIPGIFATTGFILINLFCKRQSSWTYYNPSRFALTCIFIMLFMGFFTIFSAVIASCYILVHDCILAGVGYPAIAPCIQCVCICIATFLYYFGINIEGY